MQAAIAAMFKAAIPTYHRRPRSKWIFDYSCQNTIVVSRLYFTAAVDEAFNDMEEGNENALKASNPNSRAAQDPFCRPPAEQAKAHQTWPAKYQLYMPEPVHDIDAACTLFSPS